MRRRQFLFNSGILATGMVVSPSEIWAADKQTSTAILVIHDALGSNNDIINSVLRNSTGQAIHEICEDEISTLSYSPGGFMVTTDNGREYKAGKIIFSSYKQLHMSGQSVTVKTTSKNIQLEYGATGNKPGSFPEYWALSSHRFGNGKVDAFVRRKRHAFLCIA